MWRSLRASGLDPRMLPSDVVYREVALRWWSAMGVVLLIAVIGLVLIAAPLLTKRRPTARS